MCTSTRRMMNSCRTRKANRKNESNNQKPRNLKNKYSNTKLTIINNVIFFFFVLKTRLERGKVYPAIYNRIPAGAPAGADSVWKHWLGLRFELLFTRQVTSIAIYVKGVFVRSGIRTHAYKSRLRPERSALDRSAILTSVISLDLSYLLILQGGRGGRRGGGGWVVKPSKAYWVGTRFMIHSSWNEVNLLNQLTTRTPHHLLNCLRDGSIFDQWHPR